MTGRQPAFEDFLRDTAEDDRQFLPEEELARFPSVACGMANGSGGWVVVGAVEGDGGEIAAKGVSNLPALRERVLSLTTEETFNPPPAVSLHPLSGPAPILAVHVSPAGWHSRPVCVKGTGPQRAYRRVEGVDIISGRWARFRLGLDALERLRDDRPVPGMTLPDLDAESVAAFRSAVTARRPQWAGLSTPAFLTRALVLSNEADTQDGLVPAGRQDVASFPPAITRAGALLLGKEGPLVRVELHPEGREGTTVELRNLWKAWSLLPRLTRALSDACASAFRECFVNALLHADYDADKNSGVRVLLTGRPLFARVENPGTVRAWQGSECRNFRLMKMFQLFGGARGEGWGMRAIRGYQPDFRLKQDALELSTSALLKLEAKQAQPEQTQPEQAWPAPAPKGLARPELARPEPAQAGISFGDAARELEDAVAAMRAGRSE